MENISTLQVSQTTQQQQENKMQNFPVATVFERAIAFIIDLMLWLIFSSFLYRILYKDFSPSSTYPVITFSVFIAYLTIFTTGKLQTLGKFLLGIKVINRQTKEPLTIVRSFLRALGYFISFATACIGFAFVFFSKKRLALEDLIAGSEVVTIREKSNSEMTIISFVGTVLIILSAYFVYNNLIFNPYKAMKESAEQQLLKIAYLEEFHKKHYGTYTTDLLRLAIISGDAVQFQRDMQQNFRPRGFKIGISKDGYFIEGFAKDNANPAKSSMVYFSNWNLKNKN